MNMENPIDLYDNFFFSKKFECGIFQLKNGKVFHVKKDAIEELDITEIIDSENDQVRYFKCIEGEKKWGIIHISGHEIIPPIYDYISPLIEDRFYKIFNGDYSWKFDEHSFQYFAEHIDTHSWNGDRYIGELSTGQWGLVEISGVNCTVLIAPEFQWLILIDRKIVCCNVGGSLIKWYDGDDKEEYLQTFGGLWKVIEASKWHRRTETGLGEFSEVLEQFKSEYSKQFTEEYTYTYQFIFDPQKIH
ncbi:hypothetical protein IW16_13695 [Chryseobacterium vrystaatense]|uniref:WG containing repeat-containing protein n=2 Tax=Chryseobacterium vrystaatense TaxID=307480 RepID=A0ABR4ULV6_9FLAO|nr:hypothetical protein IW16_13695 [Chryseobacterium vrystaatense]